MERLLARLERKLGRFAIGNLTTYLVGAMAFAFAICLFRDDMLGMMRFDPRFIAKQPWRVITWIVMPTSLSPIWIFFSLAFYYFIGNSLESNWGAFKYNVYLLIGALGAMGASLATGHPASNQFLLESLIFAVCTLAPNHEIFFFFFPVKLKWLGLLSFIMVVVQLIGGDMSDRIMIAASFVNYLLFFSGHLVNLLRGRRVAVRQAARRGSFRPPPIERAKEDTGRVCAICGARQADGADIRVCNCEKCGGKARELCLDHARNH